MVQDQQLNDHDAASLVVVNVACYDTHLSQPQIV